MTTKFLITVFNNAIPPQKKANMSRSTRLEIHQLLMNARHFEAWPVTLFKVVCDYIPYSRLVLFVGSVYTSAHIWSLELHVTNKNEWTKHRLMVSDLMMLEVGPTIKNNKLLSFGKISDA